MFSEIASFRLESRFADTRVVLVYTYADSRRQVEIGAERLDQLSPSSLHELRNDLAAGRVLDPYGVLNQFAF